MRKYVCFSKYGKFVFLSEHRLNSNDNKLDAWKAYCKKKGALFPSYEFQNVVRFEDYPMDEPAIN